MLLHVGIDRDIYWLISSRCLFITNITDIQSDRIFNVNVGQVCRNSRGRFGHFIPQIKFWCSTRISGTGLIKRIQGADNRFFRENTGNDTHRCLPVIWFDTQWGQYWRDLLCCNSQQWFTIILITKRTISTHWVKDTQYGNHHYNHFTCT